MFVKPNAAPAAAVPRVGTACASSASPRFRLTRFLRHGLRRALGESVPAPCRTLSDEFRHRRDLGARCHGLGHLVKRLRQRLGDRLCQFLDAFERRARV